MIQMLCIKLKSWLDNMEKHETICFNANPILFSRSFSVLAMCAGKLLLFIIEARRLIVWLTFPDQ